MSLDFANSFIKHYFSILDSKVEIGTHPCVCLKSNTIYIEDFNKENKKSLLDTKHFLCHEAGHILYSQKSELKGMKFSILNILEDRRINSLIEKRFYFLNFTQLNNHSLKDTEVELEGFNRFALALCFYLDNRDLEDSLTYIEDKEWEKPFKKSVNLLEKGFHKAVRTVDLEPLVHKIYKSFEHLLEDPQEDNQDSYKVNSKGLLDKKSGFTIRDLRDNNFATPEYKSRGSKGVNMSYKDFLLNGNMPKEQEVKQSSLHKYVFDKLNYIRCLREESLESHSNRGVLRDCRRLAYTDLVFDIYNSDSAIEATPEVHMIFDFSGSMSPYESKLKHLISAFDYGLRENGFDYKMYAFKADHSSSGCVDMFDISDKNLKSISFGGSTPLSFVLDKYSDLNKGFSGDSRSNLLFLVTDAQPNCNKAFIQSCTSLRENSNVHLSLISNNKESLNTEVFNSVSNSLDLDEMEVLDTLMVPIEDYLLGRYF